MTTQFIKEVNVKREEKKTKDGVLGRSPTLKYKKEEEEQVKEGPAKQK